jgi:hypothetical protein
MMGERREYLLESLGVIVIDWVDIIDEMRRVIRGGTITVVNVRVHIEYI